MTDPLFVFRNAQLAKVVPSCADVNSPGVVFLSEQAVWERVVCEEARDLRSYRVMNGLGLRSAAKRIGVGVQELCDLEHGRLVPEDPRFWSHARLVLECMAEDQQSGSDY